MFEENFTFDPARSPSVDSNNTVCTRNTSRSVSPCSPTGPFPPPSGYSVTDLAACFANSKLIRRDAQICYDPCDAYANLDDDAGWQIPTDEADCTPTMSSRALFKQRSQSRLQRQSSTRLLCSASHHKDIASLVSRMVQSGEQCSVAAPSSPSPGTEDEGYDEGYDSCGATSRRSSLAVSKSRLDYRRSSEMRTSGACVNKAVRFRKDKQQKRPRSSENES